MQYRTTIPTTPPITPAMRQQAMAGFAAPPTPGVAMDVYAGLSQGNAVDYDRAAQAANADYVSKARDIQNQMSMRGLQQLAQQQQNNRNVQDTLYRQSMGRTNSLLNGLLGGLFQ